jgi:hypothetical protein
VNTFKAASSIACVVVVFATASGKAIGQSSLALGPLFQDHAVLQRDKPLPIWGTAGAGEEVSVVLYGVAPGSCRFAAGTIDGTRVVLPAPASGQAPVRVRFCWGASPLCNLSDGSGLPVGPFEIPIK